MRSFFPNSIRLRSMSVCVLAACIALAGCDPDQNVGPGGENPSVAPVAGGTATLESGPIVRFDAPSQSTTYFDTQIGSIQYSVDTATAATVALYLDLDATNDNGNEIDLAAGLSFEPGVTSSSHELVAGFYPYGTYFVKARVTDGTTTNYYNAGGLVNIVASGSGFGSDEGLDPVAGLQLLHDSGKPRSVNRRIPFVDTWHVIDVLDNLAPRMVVPIEFTTDVEIHRLQFYVFGIDQPGQKRVEIYRGTDENTVGEMIHRIDVDNHLSRRNGWWNTVIPDSPIVLEAGRYGVSFHAALEFTEHWAGNAPEGFGFAWASPVQSVAYTKVGAENFGFTPNFGIRVIGKFTGKNAANGRARLPDRRAEAEEAAGNASDDGPFIQDPTIYHYPREKKDGFHVVWRRASTIGK